MNKSNQKVYDENTIQTLSARDFYRLRPGVGIGDTSTSSQLMIEIFSNALDEFTAGRGKNIYVTIDSKSNTYSVEDEGQGFPINIIKDNGKTILENAFSEFNTSGKYDRNSGVYTSSLGANGQGAKLTNFLSHFLEVVSWNEGKYEHIRFEDGVFKWRTFGEAEHRNGTLVTWQPDEQFFKDSKANISDLRKLFSEMSALCPGLKIILNIDNNTEEFESPEGIQSILDNACKDKELLSNRFVMKKEENGSMFDIALTYTTDYSDNVVAYVNYGLTESGMHMSTLKGLIAYQINKYAQSNDLLGKKDNRITASELSEGLYVIFNLKTKDVKYDSQTKIRVTDLNLDLMKKVINGDFAAWLINNPKDAKLIIDRALVARKAKEAAQNAKERIRGATNKGKKFISLPTKLVDAWSKDRSECELYITEGDSAGNGLIAKRDGKTQAVFPIRGKILSCRKAPIDKIYANQEISNLVKAIGLDIEKDTGKLIYDKKKLRYDKIIFATDADPDGYSIRLLLLNVFWWLCPELVEEGHIYVAIPPLYRITEKNNNYVYLIDDNELNEYKRTHKGSYLINRNKGLGEMDPKELAECILTPTTRVIEQLVSLSFKDTDDMLECFMGQDVKPRREYLLNHY